jgi:ankyrin repeat protein
MHHALPARLDLEWYRKSAKALVRAYGAGDPDAVARAGETMGERARERFRLSDAQWVIAQEHGHRSWGEFTRWLETRKPEPPVGRIGLEPVSAYDHQASRLAASAAAGEDGAVRRVREHVPRLAGFAGGALDPADARLVVAREYGFPTWRDLVFHVEKAIAEHEGRHEGASDVVAALDAIGRGDVAALRLLLDANPALAGNVHKGGETAWNTLLEAIAQPDVVGERLECELGVDPSVVELLIDRGSELEEPLGIAACFNRVELVQLLLAAGAEARPSAIWGITPLQMAIYHGAAEAADVLAGVRFEPDALYVAAATGRLDALDGWFDAGGGLRPGAFANRPNLTDVGWPPAPPPRDDPREVLDEAFALAAYNGRIAAMERLLERGASVDGSAHLGLTALHLAVSRQRLDVARWLLERGADPSLRDGVHDGTPLGWAEHEAAGGDPARAAMRDLLAAGLSPSALAAAFEAARATWGERGAAELPTGLTYGGVEPVLVHVTKRERRYEFSDGGAAARLAGRSAGWREAADAIEAEYVVNVSRQGVVFLPAVERSGTRWLAALPDRIAEASVALYGALLELDV